MSQKEKGKQTSAKIKLANLSQIPDIIKVEEKAWISTYPNSSAGITREDVAERFDYIFKVKRAADIEAEMADGGHSYRVLIRNGEIIGYTHLLRESDFNDFVEIYIMEDYQGQGYGSMMFRDGLKWLKQNGKPIQLEVAVYNSKAKKIYEHYGFKENPTLSQLEGEDWNLLPSGKRIPVVFMVLK